ncbi:MAG: helix-turn-helix transcriptional regulator [Ruminococcus sp.]|nr:helix-turn-helix transcriptional regulator [Ruminococcus sp.]
MHNINKYKIGERIRELREEAEETQADLANLLGVKRQIVSYFENGARIPNTEQVVVIASHYNTTTDYLLCLTDEATTNKDIQFINNYTGLDENSIETLHRLKSESVKGFNQTIKNIAAHLCGKRSQDAKTDLLFINTFINSPFNSVYNHPDSYLYEYCCKLEECIALYDQVMNFEIQDDMDTSALFSKWNEFHDNISNLKKKIRVDKYLITDDFDDVLEYFVGDMLSEIKSKDEIVREKLNSMYQIIAKGAGDE